MNQNQNVSNKNEIRIFLEENNRQFREYELNPDAVGGPQYVERTYSFELVKNAFADSRNDEEFNEIIDSEASCTLHDFGTSSFFAVKAAIFNGDSHILSRRNRVLMYYRIMAKESSCNSCVFFDVCRIIYGDEEHGHHDCSNDSAGTCDYFLPIEIVSA